MPCQYISSKGKSCKIMKVDETHGVCNKHLPIVLRKIEKDNKMKSDKEPNMEKKKIEKGKNIEVNNEIPLVKSKYNKSENKEIDELLEVEESEEEYSDISEFNEDEDYDEENENKQEEVNLSKEEKDFQLTMFKMAYNFCTTCIESLGEPYLDNFSKQCSEDVNIQKALEELNEKRSLKIFKNLSPEYKILFFTGMVGVATYSKAASKNIRKIEPPKRDTEINNIVLDEYKDL